MIDLGQKLTALRKKKNMTVDQVVALSNVTKSTASKVFSGIEQNPKMDTLCALLSAMDANLSDIDPIAQKEKALAQNERELSLKESQIVNLLPYVPETVKDGILTICAATVDQSQIAQDFQRDQDYVRGQKELADSEQKQEEHTG